MKKKLYSFLCICLAGLYIFGMFVWCLAKPADEYSFSERRKLKQFPVVSAETILDGSFTSSFEDYSADQFPLRETFRSLQALFSRYVLQKQDNNDIYISAGYAVKQEPVTDEASVSWGLSRMQFICDKYLEDNRTFFAIVPDKNYYLAEGAKQPSLDYEDFFARYREGMDGYAESIELEEILSAADYYRTDTHWRQEKLLPVMNALLSRLLPETELSALPANQNSFAIDSESPFYGVYYGQAALPMKPDTLTYLLWEGIEDCKVTCYDTGKAVEMPMYDLGKLTDKDPYEVFLDGAKAMITIENPHAVTDRELILFRDSFGSSLAPLLSQGYSKVTLVDIRYFSPARLGAMIDFEDADVLFLYSTSVLNHSTDQFLK